MQTNTAAPERVQMPADPQGLTPEKNLNLCADVIEAEQWIERQGWGYIVKCLASPESDKFVRGAQRLRQHIELTRVARSMAYQEGRRRARLMGIAGFGAGCLFTGLAVLLIF